MSSTRTADENDTTYHQSRYASAPEFERGIVGNLVAKRASIVRNREERELLWAVHKFSHEEGGLSRIVEELLALYPEKFQTQIMAQLGKTVGQCYTADEIAKLRSGLPYPVKDKFPLRGEISIETKRAIREATYATHPPARCDEIRDVYEEKKAEERLTQIKSEADAEAAKHPTGYPVAAIIAECQEAARNELERDLKDLCLDGSWPPSSFYTWYLNKPIELLQNYVSRRAASKPGSVETRLGRIVAQEFDYTWRTRCLSLLIGEARRGKTHAAKICCERNPGKARFVEVPTGANEKLFFTALARGLGIGNFLNYKTGEIRERVESVLLTGNLMLVLDEGQRLWPDRYQRYAQPGRINWLMMMVNQKVPILMIATPQFISAQQAAEKTGWNSSQLTGRLSNYIELPRTLEDADLMAICKAALPEVGEKVLQVVADYAVTSQRYLSAIEAIAGRAREMARRSGREKCITDDIKAAMKESVVPSDTALKVALAKARSGSRRTLPEPEMQPVESIETEPEPLPATRLAAPAPAVATRRGVELITD